VADADRALQGGFVQPRLEIAEFALGAPSSQRALLQRGNARRVITTIFEALERVDQLPGDRLTAHNPHNAAQIELSPYRPRLGLLMRRDGFPENQNCRFGRSKTESYGYERHKA
jgi:hypothetical protein